MIQVDWNAIQLRIIGAVVDAVSTTAAMGRERALKDVPVRHVFSGGRRTLRLKTAEEIKGDRALRRRLGLSPDILGQSQTVRTKTFISRGGVPLLRTLGNRANRFMETGPYRSSFLPGVESKRTSDIRLLSDLNKHRLAEPSQEFALTGRGRYELAHPERSMSTISGETRIGGSLRSTIVVAEPDADQYPVIHAELEAGSEKVRYAKFQEMGTRHNPAHPFLRPRLPEWRAELPRQLRQALGRLGQ